MRMRQVTTDSSVRQRSIRLAKDRAQPVRIVRSSSPSTCRSKIHGYDRQDRTTIVTHVVLYSPSGCHRSDSIAMHSSVSRWNPVTTMFVNNARRHATVCDGQSYETARPRIMLYFTTPATPYQLVQFAEHIDDVLYCDFFLLRQRRRSDDSWARGKMEVNCVERSLEKTTR